MMEPASDALLEALLLAYLAAVTREKRASTAPE
jgi:hypothetical protein